MVLPLSLIFKSLNKHLKGVSSTHYASQKILVLLNRHRRNISSHRKPVRAWRVSHIVTHMIIHFQSYGIMELDSPEAAE